MNAPETAHEDRPPDAKQVTLLLRRMTGGESSAGAELMRVIEGELHKIAAHYMRKERPDHTLQATALVNEAYLRLLGSEHSEPGEWKDRNHFLAAASVVMRQILIDYARSHHAGKRSGQKVELDAATLSLGPVSPHVLDVDAALTELAAMAPRQAQLVELRFFGGLSLEEAAEVLHMAPRTADKDWALARAWLRSRLRSA
jgi:RNA polymerase sigma-70 factor (ECF subfamily)